VTLTVLEGLNKYPKKFAIQFNKTNPDNWYILNDEELEWYIDTKGCN